MIPETTNFAYKFMYICIDLNVCRKRERERERDREREKERGKRKGSERGRERGSERDFGDSLLTDDL
jgi:hypothetical protein